MNLPTDPEANEQIFASIDELSLYRAPDTWVTQADGTAPMQALAGNQMQRQFGMQMIEAARHDIPAGELAARIAPELAAAIGSFVFYHVQTETHSTIVTRTSLMSVTGRYLRRTAVVVSEDPAVRHSLEVDQLEPPDDTPAMINIKYRVDPTDAELLEAATELFLNRHHDEEGFWHMLTALNTFDGVEYDEDYLADEFGRYFNMGEGASLVAMLPAMNRHLESYRRQKQLETEMPDLYHPSSDELADMAALVRALR